MGRVGNHQGATLHTLFSGYFLLMEQDRKGKAWALWAWLPVYLVWVNVHGGFLVRLGLLAILVKQNGFS